MPGGRPTKYNQDILDKTLAYLDDYFDVYQHVIPSIAGLSLVLDINRDTIHAWAKQDDKQEFSDMLQKLNAKQQQILISKGLSGEFNSNITKLVLTKHGYHDKQDVEVTAEINHTVQEQINFDKVREKVIEHKTEKVLN